MALVVSCRQPFKRSCLSSDEAWRSLDVDPAAVTGRLRSANEGKFNRRYLKAFKILLFPFSPDCILVSKKLQSFTSFLHYITHITFAGNKKDNVTVIYTPWSNLRKDASMATGQVSFHDPKLTKKILVPVRQNHIVNRLNKTRVERFPELHVERENDLKEKRKVERIAREEKKREEKEEREDREAKRWQKDHAYDDLLNEDNVAMSSNQDRDPDFLDDFM